jgi:hypothetical protein
MLISGPMFVYFDNVKSKIENTAIEACLTTGVYMDRILGRSEVVQIPSQAVFVTTGNHLSFGAEMMKRTVTVELNAHMSDPEKRTGFKHPDLKRWVVANRERLLGAIYSIIGEWFSRGQHRSRAKLGGFEDYCEVMGGILEMLDCRGFLDAPMESARDSESEMAENFAAAWHESIGLPIPEGGGKLGEIAYPKDLINVAEKCDFNFKGNTQHSKGLSVGWYLRKLSGRAMRGFRIEKLPRDMIGSPYRLIETGNGRAPF